MATDQTDFDRAFDAGRTLVGQTFAWHGPPPGSRDGTRRGQPRLTPCRFWRLDVFANIHELRRLLPPTRVREVEVVLAKVKTLMRAAAMRRDNLSLAFWAGVGAELAASPAAQLHAHSKGDIEACRFVLQWRMTGRVRGWAKVLPRKILRGREVQTARRAITRKFQLRRCEIEAARRSGAKMFIDRIGIVIF